MATVVLANRSRANAGRCCDAARPSDWASAGSDRNLTITSASAPVSPGDTITIPVVEGEHTVTGLDDDGTIHTEPASDASAPAIDGTDPQTPDGLPNGHIVDDEVRDEAEDKPDAEPAPEGTVTTPIQQGVSVTSPVENIITDHDDIGRVILYRDPEYPKKVFLRPGLVTHVYKNGTISAVVFYRNHTGTVHGLVEGDEPGQYQFRD